MQSLIFMILFCSFCCLLVIPVNLPEVRAQGICIPDPITVSQMDGRVVHSISQGEEPVVKAVVELFEYGYKGKRLRKVLTDDKGYYSLKKVHAGKYLLKASKPPYLLRFSVRVNLIESGEAEHQEVVISLGTNPLLPCGGGSANVRSFMRP